MSRDELNRIGESADEVSANPISPLPFTERLFGNACIGVLSPWIGDLIPPFSCALSNVFCMVIVFKFLE